MSTPPPNSISEEKAGEGSGEGAREGDAVEVAREGESEMGVANRAAEADKSPDPAVFSLAEMAAAPAEGGTGMAGVAVGV